MGIIGGLVRSKAMDWLSYLAGGLLLMAVAKFAGDWAGTRSANAYKAAHSEDWRESATRQLKSQNPFPAGTEHHQVFDKAIDKLMESPFRYYVENEVQRRKLTLEQAVAFGKAAVPDLQRKGMIRMSTADLAQIVQFNALLLAALPTSACAHAWKGTATPDDLQANNKVFAGMSAAAYEQYRNLVLRALDAGTPAVPPPQPPSEQRIRSIFLAIQKQIGDSNYQRLVKDLSAASIGDDETCWMARTALSSAVKMSPDAQADLYRALLAP
ncbi:MAG: hypothetical protein ACREPT_08985 [Rudaea sp.]